MGTYWGTRSEAAIPTWNPHLGLPLSLGHPGCPHLAVPTPRWCPCPHLHHPYSHLNVPAITWIVPALMWMSLPSSGEPPPSPRRFSPHLDSPCPHLDRLRCGERDRLLLLSLSRDRDRSRRRLSLSRDVERERRRSARGRISSCFPARFPKEIPQKIPAPERRLWDSLSHPSRTVLGSGTPLGTPGSERAAKKTSSWSGENYPVGKSPGRD